MNGGNGNIIQDPLLNYCGCEKDEETKDRRGLKKGRLVIYHKNGRAQDNKSLHYRYDKNGRKEYDWDLTDTVHLRL